LSTAQGYVQAGAEKVAPADPNAPGILNTLQSTAATTLSTGAQYIGSAHAAVTGADTQQIANQLNNAASTTTDATKSTYASAQETAKPYVDSAASTAKPYVDSANQTANQATSTAQDYTNKASTTAQDYTNKASTTAQDTYNSAASTVQGTANQASSAAQDTYGQAKSSTGNTYNNTASTTTNAGDDLAARAQDLKLNAQEGVDAYLKLGQDKASDVTNTYK